MLSTFCGIEINNIQKPQVKAEGGGLTAENHRPELKALDAQIGVLNAQEKALNAALMPKVGVFAQGFYGYPGLNMFEDMMRHKWSLNGIVGARVTWNIGALYTRKNDKAKLQLQRDMTENNREVFLFNNNLEQIQQHENIARYQKLMAQDGEIISLRQAVRKAAESKLAHGIIDANDLVADKQYVVQDKFTDPETQFILRAGDKIHYNGREWEITGVRHINPLRNAPEFIEVKAE